MQKKKKNMIDLGLEYKAGLLWGCWLQPGRSGRSPQAGWNGSQRGKTFCKVLEAGVRALFTLYLPKTDIGLSAQKY